MDKTILCAISYYKKKYYYNDEDFVAIPVDVKTQVKQVAAFLAEKIHCDIHIGFNEDSSMYIECLVAENDMDYDAIGAKLEIDRIQKQKRDLFQALSLWYRVAKLNGKGIKL